MSDYVKKQNKDLEISWIGIDGFLIVLYLAIVGIIFYALKTSNDFIVGKFIPYAVMAAVTVIFLTYLVNVFTFMKNHHEESNR